MDADAQRFLYHIPFHCLYDDDDNGKGDDSKGMHQDEASKTKGANLGDIMSSATRSSTSSRKPIAVRTLAVGEVLLCEADLSPNSHVRSAVVIVKT
jgi:hypothetical protein